MTRILITGASGYLGRHLVRQFSQEAGNQIHAVVRSDSATQALDGLARCWVYDRSYASLDDIFAKTKVDLVIHVAALATYDTTAQNIAPLIEANLGLGTFLLQAMSAHGCRRLINTGTYWQHYAGEAYNPVCLYSAMKEAFEKIADYYAQAEKFHVVTLKLTDVYGPKDPRKKLFYHLAAARNAPAPVMMSGGEQQVNLLYIQDAVAAYRCAATMLMESKSTPGHRTYFVASPESKKLRDIVDLYREMSSSPVNIEWGGRPYREREVMVPFVGTVLPDWEAKTGIIEGMRRVVQDAF